MKLSLKFDIMGFYYQCGNVMDFLGWYIYHKNNLILIIFIIVYPNNIKCGHYKMRWEIYELYYW